MRFRFWPAKAPPLEKEAADRASVNETKGKLAAPPHRRFLTGRRQDYLRYIQAARDYVSKVGGADAWMFLKPYSRDSLLEFSNLMYDVMNLLGVMRVPPKGRILEVGSGAGWLTEILAGLGYEIYALEPSAEMIDAAHSASPASSSIIATATRRPSISSASRWRNVPCPTGAWRA